MGFVNFKSDHKHEFLEALRQEPHTIQLICLDGTITASALLLATVSPLIKVSLFFKSLLNCALKLPIYSISRKLESTIATVITLNYCYLIFARMKLVVS